MQDYALERSEKRKREALCFDLILASVHIINLGQVKGSREQGFDAS